jgi:hypothetical protein
MTTLNISGMGRAAALILGVLTLPAAAQGPQSTGAEAGWAAMTKCAAMADEKLRHRCTDDALRSAGLLASATGGRQEAPAAAVAATASANAGAAPGKSRAPADPPSSPSDFGLQPKAAAKAAPPESEKHAQVVLAKVEQGVDGRLLLTTTDGAKWQQLETGPLHKLPAQGDAMSIDKTTFGGYMCKPAQWPMFRCVRSR